MPEKQPEVRKVVEKVEEEASAGTTRRDLFHIGNVLALPVLLGGAQSAKAMGPLRPGPEIYQSIGVEPVINCRGTFTIIGASVELPEVRAAMDAAAKHYVQLDELADAVGRRLAELTGAEWGMVSAGCAAGLKHVTAACVAGGNPEKLLRIPDLTGMDKTEVVIPRSSRNAYDHAVRNIGVRLIVVNTAEELEKALSSRTAMIYLTAGGPAVSGPLSLEAVAKVAKPWDIPILVDAAAEVLTIPSVHLQRGATVVAYSGGKAICGPQCAGLLLGRKDILMSAWQASSPHHGPGRDNKVGREETLGMVAAVEAWVKRDHKAEWNKWLSYLDTISKRLSQISGVSTAVREPTGLSNRSPSLSVWWDPERLHITGEEVAEIVARSKPRIALGAGGGGGGRGNNAPPPPDQTSISITAWMMRPGDDKVVADRLFAVLGQRREPKPPLASPSGNISGRWDVNVEFFSSKSQHSLILEQDGNRLHGVHKGDFSVRDVFGTIEGNSVKLQSNDRMPGDSITFTFAGTISGDTISGPIYMGEYLNAKFTAQRHSYPAIRGRVLIPGGPPLAN
ncbi:MAG TPA: aminotransferase class V-fold PLP-dependent enzyme [Bryobacteraceae bacterium]|nr:aminotransferase class V-fold PLP-dependent enzyme [Bryobacteraceae bacterium]